MPRRRAEAADRYSAKLLFEFFITVDGRPMVRRMCEERIIVVHAFSAKGALREALRAGKASEFRFQNGDGDPGHFRLVGVLDLLRLGVECVPGEVWYDITQRVRPSERRASIVPPTAELHAFREEALVSGQKARKAAKRGAAQR